MLRNVPVVLGERNIGLFQTACFDPAQKRVCALIVSCGMHGKRIVKAQDVRMIAEEFILIDGFSKYRRSNKQQNTPFVRDTTGLLAGRVTDYAIDRKTLDVMAIEVTPGYLFGEQHKRTWIYAYNRTKTDEALSIPAVLHNCPYLSREENEICECPP